MYTVGEWVPHVLARRSQIGQWRDGCGLLVWFGGVVTHIGWGFYLISQNSARNLLKHTWLRASLHGFLPLIGIPCWAVAAHKASDAFWINLLPVHTEGSLLSLCGALALLADHELYIFGFDVFADVPCGEAVLVLFLSLDIWS